MQAGGTEPQAPPTWRQAALLSLAERAPMVVGVLAVLPALGDDAKGLTALVVVVLVLGALGTRIARRAAESMGVAQRPQLPDSVQATEIVALAVVGAVVLLVLDGLPVAMKGAIFVAAFVAIEATAATAGAPPAYSPWAGT